MVGWRRVARLALVAVLVAVGAAVYLGLRDRTEPARALVVEPIDPDAVMETRGSRIVQADALGQNFEILSGRQITYADGGMRLFDRVEVTVADRENRAGFQLTGDEATVDAAQTNVHVAGGVRMRSTDGLSAETETADYADAEGVIRMPGPTTFQRDGLTAQGDEAAYERDRDVLHLLSAARVEIHDDRGNTLVDARRATLAQPDGYMLFEDDVRIARGDLRMRAARARAITPVDSSTIETLDLSGGSTIDGAVDRAGAVRRMAAREMTLAYADGGGGVERITLGGGAVLVLFGANGRDGTRVQGEAMEVTLDSDQNRLAELAATRDVRLDVPGDEAQPAQTVSAQTLTLTGGDEGDAAVFEGGVEYREGRTDGEGEARVTRADRLEATLGAGMGALDTARFLGNVVLADGSALGYADEATYATTAGIVTLVTSGPASRAPRLDQTGRGSIQAATIALGLDEGGVTATGQVETVLTRTSESAESTEDARRPGMLEADEPIYVTSERLVYDEETAITTYAGGARLWQSSARVDGDEIVLDEQAGDLDASGQVRTESVISQINDETGLAEESLTRGRGQQFRYEDARHLATYTGDAGLRGPRGDLTASRIRVYLQPDGRTLDRIEAEERVVLDSSTRWLSGERLVYHDADGRYEMDGQPVRIIERAERQCRETTGRRLTFFLTEDAVTIDGESEIRTEANGIPCPAGTVGP